MEQAISALTYGIPLENCVLVLFSMSALDIEVI